MSERDSRTPTVRTYSVRLSAKGQLVVPKEVRLRHGWSVGVDLVLEDEGDRILICSARRFPETNLEDLVGCAGSAKTLVEMEAAIARGDRERR